MAFQDMIKFPHFWIIWKYHFSPKSYFKVPLTVSYSLIQYGFTTNGWKYWNAETYSKGPKPPYSHLPNKCTPCLLETGKKLTPHTLFGPSPLLLGFWVFLSIFYRNLWKRDPPLLIWTPPFITNQKIWRPPIYLGPPTYSALESSHAN